MRKKLLLSLLAAMCCMSMWAQTGPADNEIWYTSSTGEAVDNDYFEYMGLPLKSNTYTDGKGVATFEETITTIPEDVFSWFGGFTSINLPASVTTIGADAFANCENLASITIPGVTEIGYSAFNNCTAIASVTLPEVLEVIGEYAFCGTGITSIELPEGLEEIGSFAFASTGLTSVTIPASVTTIGDGLFSYSEDLAVVTFEEDNNLVELGEGVFEGTAITEIEWPAAITSIPAFTFSGCANLESVTISGEITEIGGTAFNGCSGLSSFVIPASVTTIGEYAFSGAGAADGVLSFADGSKCTAIPEQAFNNAAFGSVILPEGMTEIGTCGFMGCENLKSIVIPESMETIEGFAFMGCTSLESVVIPEGVTSVGDQAFYECENLETVTFAGESKIEYLGGDVFSSCPNLRFVIIPDGISDLYGSNFEDSGTADGYLALADGVTHIGGFLFYGSNCESYVVPASVKSIGFAAYACCENMKELIMLCPEPPALDEKGPFDSFDDTWKDIPDDVVLVVPSGCKSAYEAAGWDAWFTIKEGEPLNVTEVGWASFYTGVALDIPSCAKVYYASAASGSTLTLTEITGTIPAATAVIVQIPAGTLFPVSESTPAAIEGNLLRGTLTDITRTEEVYVLSPASSKESPVFQNYTGTTLGAGKAYILKSDLDPAASNMLRFVFGEATHIEAVSTDDTNADAPMYNMAGQRVSDDYRGLVIKNGKKMWNN